jgi:CheY-like chemotaxis protein
MSLACAEARGTPAAFSAWLCPRTMDTPMNTAGRAAASAVHVLVVDDEVDIRETLREALLDADYVVYEAPNGALALQRMVEHPQGMVVLLDLNMPVMDGRAVLRALSANPDLAERHRIIVISARYGPTVPLADAQILTLYATGILPKPLDLKDLYRVVAHAARSLDHERRG